MPESVRGPVRREEERLVLYLSLLCETNRITNLVSARSAAPAVLVDVHLLDALFGLTLMPERARTLLDVGSGGGLPAIPLLLVRRDLRGTLVESVNKKAEFLRGAASRLGLEAEVITARFPEGIRADRRFDLLTTRALASPGRLVRRARRFLAPGAAALLWTTADEIPALGKESAAAAIDFHLVPGAERKGIAVLRLDRP